MSGAGVFLVVTPLPTTRATYRRCMNQFSESAFQDSGEGPSFLSRVGIAFVLLTAGIGLAVLISLA